ncbi:MAG TPA: hypothetical protein DCY42_01470, partial [Chloroflexi bacterium]|nr:hypothetical protein [Chloroflexota bacterium]
DLTRICLTLDGLPLAIELCAPMIKIFPPDVIADRIEKSLDVIPSGPRDLPARQQTLQDVIQWSFDLLQEHEKRLFVRLAVFNGGGTLQAVEAICGHGISGKMENILSDLVNKNLVIARKGQDGDIHFSLLETIRQYGRDKLRVLEEAEEIADRHTQYYMKLAKQAAVELRGPDQISWTDRLLAIQDNIRAALDRLIESGEVETALRFSCDLYEFWLRHSDIEEGRRWLEQVMKLPGAQEYQELYTNTLINLAWLLWLQYKKESKPLVEQALELARAHTSQSNTAKALATLGMISINQGNITQAQDYLEESSQIYHAIQEEWGYARSCMGLAVIQKVQNQYEAASALYSKAYHLYKKMGDIHFQCVVLRLIGDLELKCNNLTGGTDAYRESLMIARAVKSNLQVANNLWGLARVAKLQGNHTRAVQLFLASKKVFEDIGAWWSGDDPELEEVLTTAQVALGEPEFLSVREQGHHMTMEMAIELALGNAGDI